MAHIFISYSRENYNFVQRLITDLKQAGIQIYIDQVGLKPGTPDWEQALRDAISAAHAILLIASPVSRRSPYVRDELAIAKDGRKTIYPVWAAGKQWIDCIPLGLGHTQYVDMREDAYTDGLQKLINALCVESGSRSAAILPELTTTPDTPPRNPYKGLRPFRAEDRGDFFGRTALVNDLVAALHPTNNGSRFLAVIGPSGSGKSSVVMAGLLPALQDGALDGSRTWIYLEPMIPGTQPLENLAIRLARALPHRSQRAILEDLQDPTTRGLHRVGCEVATQPGTRLVLYVDQFEELFTLVPHENERQQFIDLVTTAVSEPSGPVTVILSMRADFYDRPMQYGELCALLEQCGKVVPPMALADLYDVVQEPADLSDVRLKFDDGLVTELVFAVRDEVGGLPLLQFTLDQLFRRSENRRLTRTDYEAIGGVRGALRRHAEATIDQLPTDSHRQMARALFLRLIEPGATEQDTTRRRAVLNELDLPDAEQTRLIHAAADAFISARLLVTGQTGQETTIEVAHEALIREWRRLGEWLHDAREDVRLQKAVSADAAEWTRRGQKSDDDMLYRGTVLEEADAWARRSAASIQETAFINASMQAQARRKAAEARIAQQVQRFRQASAVLLIVFLLALGGVVWALLSAQSAQDDRNQAETQQAVARQEQANAQTQAANAQADSAQAQTQAANAETQQAIAQQDQAEAELQLGQATATLAYVQDQGTAVAAQATYFSIEQNRIGTLSAGAVVIPPGTMTPDVFLPTLTAVAELRTWQPHIIVDDFGVEMVEVPPGCFMMGSVAGANEQPVHDQCFDEPFYIDRYEVTNWQFEAVTEQTPPSQYIGSNRPVESITWFDARDFCIQRGARLPTEREWEYAARGPDSFTYPWGNVFVPEYAVTGHTQAQGTLDVIGEDGQPLRPGGASWVGALDMGGNVAEWTSTRYDDIDYSEQTIDLQNLYPYPYVIDDGRETDESFEDYQARQPLYTTRVFRGGSFDSNANTLRAASRYWNSPGAYNFVGFRCARSQP